MAQSNSNDSDTNDGFDNSSRLSEMKENYERKINELHLEFSQLKVLMIDKTNNDSQPSSSQGPSKQPQIGRDMVTGVTETCSTRPPSNFPNNFRGYQDDDTDEEADSTPRSNEERLLTAIESLPQRIKG